MSHIISNMDYSPLPVSGKLVLYLVIVKDEGLGSTKNKGQDVYL